ncbi:MAG: hypothetical protein IJL81_00075, partial [Clostridia bacterium]|nr:hypothetical protein [Clostridia bacterium]
CAACFNGLQYAVVIIKRNTLPYASRRNSVRITVFARCGIKCKMVVRVAVDYKGGERSCL